ncbi:small nuclear ribonucleoprotein [Halobacillus seohaensis]|uniref:Small nuclear ribonucleoprotein n=1 Tax=Halobacillus seohaensis TaxID=447421 RepID=A0ABW2EKW3_9BACI
MTEDRNMHHQGHQYMKPTHSHCEKYKHYHVMISLEDGSSFDGIIINVSDDGVTVLISEDVMVDENGNEEDQSRQYYGGYGGRRRRARRFRRSLFPLTALSSLLLYPYYQPYPYYPYY